MLTTEYYERELRNALSEFVPQRTVVNPNCLLAMLEAYAASAGYPLSERDVQLIALWRRVTDHGESPELAARYPQTYGLFADFQRFAELEEPSVNMLDRDRVTSIDLATVRIQIGFCDGEVYAAVLPINN